MARPKELKQLLRALQETSSPVGRVKLLARAWRTLGRFDPRELRELAASAGLHEVEGHRLYVTRGIGMERFDAPRVRFLCPPEITVITLARMPRGARAAVAEMRTK